MKTLLLKTPLKITLLGLCVFWVAHFCKGQTEGFTLLRIQGELPPSKMATSPPLPDIFSQHFSYLASGGQTYAFISEDGQYVLKFLKRHHHSLPRWQKLLPSSKTKGVKREKKRRRDMSSYQLCMEFLPDETGLLYTHLNETEDLKTTVTVIDKISISHCIDLDRTAFILQKRAIMAYDYLEQLIEARDLKGAKAAIASICELIISRCQKGIYDEDPHIYRNIGFAHGSAILVDVGRLKRDPRRCDPKIQREDLKKITAKMKDFLKEHSDELARFLDARFLDDWVENQPI